MERTIIYLIRHSEQLKIKGNVLSKDSDQVQNEKIVLSVDGEEKARILSENEELHKIDVLFSSNYARAISTAKYISAKNNIEINIDERLGERKLRWFKWTKKITGKVGKKMIIQQSN